MKGSRQATTLLATNIVLQLRTIIKAARSTPQRRKRWEAEVKLSLSKLDEALDEVRVLMLILDVRTRWGSTYHMLRKLQIICIEV